MKKSEESLVDALTYAQLPSLPDVLNPDTPVWIYAIAKVCLNNNTESYAVVRNSYGDTPFIVRSFGDYGVAHVIEVYPYKFLDSEFLPNLNGVAETKAFIAKVYGVDKTEVANLKKESLLKLLYNYCIKKQIASDKNKEKLKQIISERERFRFESMNSNNTEDGK